MTSSRTVYVSSEIKACHFGYRQDLPRNITHQARAFQVSTTPDGMGDQASIVLEGPESVGPIDIDDWVLVWISAEEQEDRPIFFGTVASISVSQRAMPGTGASTQYQIALSNWSKKFEMVSRDVQGYVGYKLTQARGVTGATDAVKSFPTLASLVGTQNVFGEPYVHVAIVFEYLARYGSAIAQPQFLPRCLSPGAKDQYRLIDWVGKIHRNLGFDRSQHSDPDNLNITLQLDKKNLNKLNDDSAWKLQDWRLATKTPGGYQYPGGSGKFLESPSLQGDPTPLPSVALRHSDQPWNEISYRMVVNTSDGPKRSRSLIMDDGTTAPMNWLLSVSMRPNPRPSYAWKNPSPPLTVAGLDEKVRPANIDGYKYTCAKFVVDASYLESVQLSRDVQQGTTGYFNFWLCQLSQNSNQSMESKDLAMLGNLTGWTIPTVDMRSIATHGLTRFMGRTDFAFDTTSVTSSIIILKPLILRTYLMRAWTEGFDRLSGTLILPVFGTKQPSPGDCIIIVNPSSATFGGRSVLAGNSDKVQRDLEGLGLTNPTDVLVGYIDAVTTTVQVDASGKPTSEAFVQVSHVLRGRCPTVTPPRDIPGNHHMPIARGWSFADVGISDLEVFLRDDPDVYEKLNQAKMDALATPVETSSVPDNAQTEQPPVTKKSVSKKFKTPRGEIKPPRPVKGQNPSLGLPMIGGIK